MASTIKTVGALTNSTSSAATPATTTSTTSVTETKVAVVPTEFEKAVAAWKLSKDDDVITLIKELEDYVAKMSPGVAISNDNGVKMQIRLFRLISNVLKKADYSTFKRLWIILLAFFNRYGASETGVPMCGVLGERFVLRFSEYWPANDDQMGAFFNIVNLILVSAAPEGRAERVRKSADLTNTMRTFFGEQARLNVSQFYSS